MIKIHYNSDSGAIINAYDSDILNVPEPFIEVTDAVWLACQSRPCKIAGGVLCDDLDALKEKKKNLLWKNFKAFQERYIDAEDLTLAVVCANGGSVKGAAVQAWVMNLWAQYYTRKDALESAATVEAVETTELSAESFGAPPYTVRELNGEAAEAMKGNG